MPFGQVALMGKHADGGVPPCLCPAPAVAQLWDHFDWFLNCWLSSGTDLQSMQWDKNSNMGFDQSNFNAKYYNTKLRNIEMSDKGHLKVQN